MKVFQLHLNPKPQKVLNKPKIKLKQKLELREKYKMIVVQLHE